MKRGGKEEEKIRRKWQKSRKRRGSLCLGGGWLETKTILEIRNHGESRNSENREDSNSTESERPGM